VQEIQKMNRIFKTFLTGTLFLVITIAGGCAKEIGKNPGNNYNEKYVLDFVEVRPDSPAVLEKGQKLYVTAYYAVLSQEAAFIWARPYYRGQLKAGYRAHPLIPVGGDQFSEGMSDMWFLFEEPATIDEIRIMLKSRHSDTILKTISLPAKISWQ
jgi:hypothetical protein